MIRHLVTFQFRPDLPPGQVDRIDEALGALAAAIPALREYSFGANLGLPAANGDYAITALVDDEAGLAAYLSDPTHRQIAETLIDPHARAVIAVQITV